MESEPVSVGVPKMMSIEMGVSNSNGNNGGNEIERGGDQMEMLAKKKRGRPRKYGPEGSMELSLSPIFTSSSPSSEFAAKRGRGRPPGSGRRQVLASFGEWIFNTAGGNFTPHVVTINTGEDVAAKIFSFSQKGPRAICILSANGAISNVTIRQPGSSGGILTYEGRFEILALSGSFTISDIGDGVRSRTGGLSVSLAGPDGRVIGGGVAGLLMAASPIQVVVGSFMPNSLKPQKIKHHVEPLTASAIPEVPGVVRPISEATPDDDNCMTPASRLPEQSPSTEADNSLTNNEIPNPTSSRNVGWPVSQSMQDQRPSPDINICLQSE
ncbi:hypothetical protein Sjap_013591 [Stephania japonica]|uniref:AT-hook motif nuclear-localized protein n=1 Tax=Stephania japonica TaxID=461633 RepID=A0AAP0IYA0_9MAGN